MSVRSALLNTLYGTRLHRLVPPGTFGLGAILMLHHVRPEPGVAFLPNKGLSVTPEFLDKVLGHLTNRGFEIVDLDTVAARLSDPDHDAERPFVALTLDDGYRNNRDYALPIFEKHNAPHTIYVSSDLASGRGCLWWEVLERALQEQAALRLPAQLGGAECSVATLEEKQRYFMRVLRRIEVMHPYDVRALMTPIADQAGIDIDALCSELVMGWDELAAHASHPLVSIGGHTITHPRLTGLADDDVANEINGGLDAIAARLGTRPRHFAYPYGSALSASSREYEIAAGCGLRTAVTTRKGLVTRRCAKTMTALPRIPLNGHFQDLQTVELLLSGIPTGLLQSAAAIRDLAARGFRSFAFR